VRLEIFTQRGELVRSLANETLSAGSHNYLWNGRDERGAAVASGFYLVRFMSDNLTRTWKISLLK